MLYLGESHVYIYEFIMCICPLHYNRTNDKINHIFIHLNLCIALASGLIVFVAGIETATEYRVSSQCKQQLIIQERRVSNT